MTWRKLSDWLWLPVLGVALLVSSCSNGCEETRETFCLTSLTSETGLSISSLYAWGIGQQHVRDESSPTGYTDSLMLSEASPKELSFILRPDTTVTRIRLQMTVSGDSSYQVEDTLTIRYEPRSVFLNMDCGCSVFFTLSEVSVTEHFIQEATIKNAEITNTENVNIALVY